VTFHAATDRSVIRAEANSVRFVRVQFTAPDAAHAAERPERRPLDVAVVIDRSGSMDGPKLELAKVAARRIVEALSARDRVALIVYDTGVDCLAPAAPLTADHRARLLSAIDRIEAGTATNLSGGWLTGCEEVSREFRPEAITRVLLLSDGLANAGITDHLELQQHAEALRARGVSTSTFGIGDDFDERLLEGLAHAAAGNFYYVRDAEQIPEFLTGELGEALEIIARDVQLVVSADPAIEVLSLDERRIQTRGRETRVALNDVVSRQRTEMVLRVRFPASPEGATHRMHLRIEDADGVLEATPTDLTWRTASDAENEVAARDVEVDRAVATRYAAIARRDAAELNRNGHLVGARALLLATAGRIASYAKRDPAMRALIRELKALAVRHRCTFRVDELKDERMIAWSVRESREALGFRRRD
jgi:Mg-chelatase subunit ChlD